jgi:hypothetical protein
LLIKLYFAAETEWDALDLGEIDITDWPLTEIYYTKFTTPPEDAYIDAQYYSGEFGIFLLDVNNNNRPFLGNPEDPLYPNAVYPNNPFEKVEARQALWHLHDKPTWLPVIIGTGFYEDLYTTHGSAYGAFSLALANPYPYSPAAAGALLDSIGVQMDDGTGHRYYDLNDNDVYDGGDEYLEIEFAIRNDHYHRQAISDNLVIEMQGIGLRVTTYYGPSALLGDYWFYGKNVHMYSAGWSLGVEPDHVILWLSDFYWHPGFCYNTGYVDDTQLDSYALGTWLANTEPEALTNCLNFQQRFADIAAAVPWWTYAGTKAVYRTYTGGTGGVAAGDGEDPYRGNYWDGIVNFPGYGLDSFFTFLNMHPRGFGTGSGDMTIRWAYKTDTLKSFNPVYSEWLWEWNTLGLIYDSLLVRNPYSALELIPWQAADYETSIYNHPVFGDTTKVFFTLNPDVHWADGTPMTTADVYFTWVELANIVMGRGLPPPWWYSSVAHILSFTIYDAYNFEVLLDVKSVYATMWVGGNVILPKHIWKPMAEGTVGDVQAAAADVNMVGNGPYRAVEYRPNSHVLLTANEPGKTVTTDLDTYGVGTPLTSPTGYTRLFSAKAETYVYDPIEHRRRAKVPYNETVEMRFEFTNLWYNNSAPVEVTTVVEIDDAPIYDATQPVGFNEKADYVSLLFAARAFDYGYSWWHKYAEVGPYFDIFAYHKVLYIYTTTLLVVDIEGTPIYTHSTTGLVKVHIIVYFWTFDHPGISECTTIMSDYELSWHTLITDISGGTWYDQAEAMIRPELIAAGLYDFDFGGYPFKSQLLTPDIKVDILDIALAAKGFGSYPGHERWSAIADINTDYKIDILDIATIAKDFGWVG